MSVSVASWQRFFLEITNRCNFDCLFCPSGISQRPKRDMEARLARGIIDQLAEGGFSGNLYFHVLGEPLLHRDLFELIDHAAQAGLRPVLFTNGGALTDQVVERVLGSRAHELVISMQTINRPSYDLLRRTPLSWEAYRDRIAHALAVAQHATAGPSFLVSIGVKNTNTSHPQALYFSEYESPQQIKQSLVDIWSETESVSLAEVFAALDAHGLADLPTFNLTDRLRLSVKLMGNWRAVWQDEPVTFGACPFFGREMAVLSDGSLTFCHIDYDGRTACANLTKVSLQEALSRPEHLAMTEAFISEGRVPKGCAYCRGARAGRR